MLAMMPFILLILHPISILLFRPTTAFLNNNRITVSCTGTYYHSNSIYQTDLNTLLSSLTSKSSFSNYGNVTTGTSPNYIHGLYICQGDLTPADCQTCVHAATANITASGSCPNSRQAIIWYDYCMVRYSDANFFGIPDSTGFSMTNLDTSQTITWQEPYEMVSNLVHLAPFRRPMFASNSSINISSYAMAQCTDDLTSVGCSQCLNTILSNIKLCCTHANGWRYLSASCSIRYEGTSFLSNPNDTYIPIIEFECSADSLQYGNNLNTFLLDVILKAAPTGFYNNRQSQLFGLALCRADIPIPSDDCNNCLMEATNSLMTRYCPNKTEGTVWYEKCMVRYSNENFFGAVDYDGTPYCGVKPISDKAGNDNVAFVTALIGVAANNKLMFTANDMGDGSTQKGYALVQCSRDLSSEGCTNCLHKGMDVMSSSCKKTNGWRYLSGSCTIRYEEFAFFNTSAIENGASAPGDENKRSQLDWMRRRRIIAGIARGLLYLHEDSLLKVIHRDMKASNVLLDKAMNPKISDFGMAKIFERDGTEVNTGRVVGTFGYMAPEYAMDGICSEKSDVYSFGVLLLEIVSGQRNGRSHFEKHGQTLLRHAWQLWSEATTIELIDELLGDSYPPAEVMRVIHIGLLCVQENVVERPTMSIVVIALQNNQMVLPEPTQPSSFFRKRNLELDLHPSTSTTGASINEVTITDVTPR